MASVSTVAVSRQRRFRTLLRVDAATLLLGEKGLASASSLLASASSSLLPESASSLLVDELLAAGHLAGTSVLFVEELCAASSLLLVSAGGLFLDKAMVFVHPQVVNGPLPILLVTCYTPHVPESLAT